MDDNLIFDEWYNSLESPPERADYLDLIRKVRTDEQEQYDRAMFSQYRRDRDAELADLRAKVEALPTRGIGARVIDAELETYGLVERKEVLDLIDGSSDDA